MLPFTQETILRAAQDHLGYERSVTHQALVDLYFRKMISHWRTSNPYLPLSMKPDMPLFMAALEGDYPTGYTSAFSGGTYVSPVWIKDAADHHGIIPLKGYDPKQLSSMSEPHRKVFDLIARRFIAVFEYEGSGLLSTSTTDALNRAADYIDKLEADVSDENAGLWRYWNRKARELAEELAALKATAAAGGHLV